MLVFASLIIPRRIHGNNRPKKENNPPNLISRCFSGWSPLPLLPFRSQRCPRRHKSFFCVIRKSMIINKNRKSVVPENDTSDFVKHTGSITSSSRFVAEGERREESERVSSAANVRCGKQEHPIEKGLRGVRVSQGPKSGPWETPGPN